MSRSQLVRPPKSERDLQSASMTKRLRTALWNVVVSRLLSQLSANSHGMVVQEYHVLIALWKEFFCLPMDEYPRHLGERRDEFRQFFETCEWFQVYDFFEFCASRMIPYDLELLEKELNAALAQEGAGYRMLSRQIIPLGSEVRQEVLKESFDLFQCYELKQVASALQQTLKQLGSPLRHSRYLSDISAPKEDDKSTFQIAEFRSALAAAWFGFLADIGQKMDAKIESWEELFGLIEASEAHFPLQFCVSRLLCSAFREKPENFQEQESLDEQWVGSLFLLTQAVSMMEWALGRALAKGLVELQKPRQKKAAVQDPWGERRVGV